MCLSHSCLCPCSSPAAAGPLVLPATKRNHALHRLICTRQSKERNASACRFNCCRSLAKATFMAATKQPLQTVPLLTSPSFIDCPFLGYQSFRSRLGLFFVHRLNELLILLPTRPQESNKQQKCRQANVCVFTTALKSLAYACGDGAT